MVKSNEPLVLKIVDKCVKPFLSKDLNYGQIREILKLKLIMDRRRVSLSVKAKEAAKKIGKEPDRSMLFTCIIYLFFGIFIAVMQIMPSVFGANIFAYGMLIFMLFSVYISEYSAVLLDTTEKSFYGVLPVGQKEISTAKNIHIAYYIGAIASSLMLPSVVTAFIFHSFLYGILFIIISIVVTVFCLHLAGTIYYLLLKVFSGEKLKDILSGFQVFITIAMVLGYQIIPRVVNFAELSKMEFNPFMFIIPSAWFSGIISIFFATPADVHYYMLAGMAILAAVLLEILYKKKVVPEFEGELDKLTETAKENKSLSVFSNFMCKVLSKDKQENAFMKLVLIQISRNRDIKLKLYPQLANVLILPLVILLSQFSSRNGGGFEKVIETIRESRWTLVMLYSVGLTSSAIYTLIGQSENKESLLFYQVLPIENLSKCIRAGIKVVIFRYLTPIFAVLSLMFFAVFGIKALPDIIIAYAAFIFITGLMIRLNAWVLPFSSDTVTGNAGYNMLMFFMNMAVLGGFSAAHIFLLNALPLKILGILVLIMLNILLWKLFMNKKYVIARE